MNAFNQFLIDGLFAIIGMAIGAVTGIVVVHLCLDGVSIILIPLASNSADGIAAGAVSGLFWWALFESIGAYVDRSREPPMNS